MVLYVSQKLRLLEDKTDTVYAVRGVDPISKRFWLCVIDPDYDGYDGDLIVSAGVTPETLRVHVKDDRSSLPNQLTIDLIALPSPPVYLG